MGFKDSTRPLSAQLHLSLILMCALCLMLVSSSTSIVTAAATVEANGEGADSNSHEYFGVLLDAGSTGTKLKIYKYSPPLNRRALPHLSLVTSKKFRPALATYSDSRQGLEDYLIDIISRARDIVPDAMQDRTPIFVMATAGLRVLTRANVMSLLEMTRSALTNKTINPFRFSPISGATVLSGEEEGIYSWIAANYLLGFFDGNKPASESVGVLEMGGSSTQITFIPDGPLYAEEFHVNLAGRRHDLYVQSYLQYGMNGMTGKVDQYVINQNLRQSIVNNPCMLRGDTRNTSSRFDNSLVTMEGSGDPESCEQILHTLLRSETGSSCQPKPCAIGPVYQPRLPNITFYATQAFGYAPRNLKTVGSDNILDINKLREAASYYCKKTLEEATKDLSTSKRFASNNCLAALYFPVLLTTSYGFEPNTTAIRLTSEVKGQRIDWTLGAMLMQLSHNGFGDKPYYNVTYAKGNNSAASAFGLGSVVSLLFSFCIVVLENVQRRA